MDFIVNTTNMDNGEYIGTYIMSHPEVAWNPDTVKDEWYAALRQVRAENPEEWNVEDVVIQMRKNGWTVTEKRSDVVVVAY